MQPFSSLNELSGGRILSWVVAIGAVGAYEYNNIIKEKRKQILLEDDQYFSRHERKQWNKKQMAAIKKEKKEAKKLAEKNENDL
mmetsp:Transcript_35400/g.82096  ORF Transcript_35400/g.82096 Transcript_35400/m.82096 type:complete len:84 (+) Transcript_35400:1097-1348(+)